MLDTAQLDMFDTGLQRIHKDKEASERFGVSAIALACVTFS